MQLSATAERLIIDHDGIARLKPGAEYGRLAINTYSALCDEVVGLAPRNPLAKCQLFVEAKRFAAVHAYRLYTKQLVAEVVLLGEAFLRMIDRVQRGLADWEQSWLGVLVREVGVIAVGRVAAKQA